jgi:hypothetical protein
MNLYEYYHLAKRSLHNIYYEQNLVSKMISKCINKIFKEIFEFNRGLTGRGVINFILLNNLELTKLTRYIIISYLNKDNLNRYFITIVFSTTNYTKDLNKNDKYI